MQSIMTALAKIGLNILLMQVTMLHSYSILLLHIHGPTPFLDKNAG